MNTFAAPCRIRGQRPLTAWVLAAFVATATLLGFGARASAQELSIPVMVQTRPQVPGARFALDGTEFVANQHGLAVTTVAEPGIYELAVLSPRVEVGGTSHSFSVWTGGERVSSRPLEVGSFTLLEAGFDTTRAVSFRFADQSGTAIEPGRVDHASIGESDGDNRYRLNGTQPTRVLASRAVPNGTEVELQPVSYRLIEAVVDGRYVYDLGSDIEVGVDSSVAIPVALSTEPREGPVDSSSSASNPVDEAGGAMPWAVPVLIGLLAVIGAAWLWHARFETPGWQWTALLSSWTGPLLPPRRRTGGPGDAGGQLPGRMDKEEWRFGVDSYLRVHMKSGRVIDGWTRPTSETIDDPVLTLFRIEYVYDQNGTEVVSSPLDVFLLLSQVARIEHIDASTGPPPNIGPSADVVRLEEKKEAVDLRDITSRKASKRRRSKDRSA